MSFETSVEAIRVSPTRLLAVGETYYCITPFWMSADTMGYWNVLQLYRAVSLAMHTLSQKYNSTYMLLHLYHTRTIVYFVCGVS